MQNDHIFSSNDSKRNLLASSCFVLEFKVENLYLHNRRLIQEVLQESNI